MMDALSLLVLPFVAGVAVLISHVPFGREVLRRGIVFLDLAIAQAAAAGFVAAAALGATPGGIASYAAALTMALVMAAGIAWAERRFPAQIEALIGTLFVLAASAVVLLLAHSPHGPEELKGLLEGQLLWVTRESVVLMLIVSVLTLIAWRPLGRALPRAGFHVLFAVAITLSVSLVGIYLVFASLILPALAVRGLRDRRAWRRGVGIGVAGYALGLAAAWAADLPAGASVVWSLALISLLAHKRG
jgi:zinc/manganese transport system permease protein